jgi:hypothetical protein
MLESKDELHREFAIANSQCAISESNEEDGGSVSSVMFAGAVAAGSLGAMLL